jgi:hypothetical protein
MPVGLAPWIPVAASTGAALVTGFIAVLTLWLNIRAQRRLEATKTDLQFSLEEQKAVIARREAAFTQDREARSALRQNAFLPFLQSLQIAITASYPVGHLLPYFPTLGARIPVIRSHADAVLSPWAYALMALTQHQIEVLLAADPGDLQEILVALIELVNQANLMIEKRALVWHQASDPSGLLEAQRSFVAVGYRLMTLVTTAALHTGEDGAIRSEEDNAARLDLSLQLEKASMFSLPFAKSEEFAWVALWELSMMAEWEQFVLESHGGTNQKFEIALMELAKTTHDDSEILEVQMMSVSIEGSSSRVYCLAARFPSPASLHSFLIERLPQLRKAHRVAWSAHRRPYELVFPSEDKPSRSLSGIGAEDTRQSIG